ncbi:SRPBCC family protein [Epilithonimonas ginsengisoli]|uniref:SRPBCC family protein n=1 Tax=Epilithonimonas ginsengisoli TaxID=1245592 RepID=A0ABU4JLY5_9FLAO|nr:MULTISPECIES: SRPBCC family protein [Chryseobacterium group]MBV6881513.1 SRPBCC family protein [Epilithonimonas sp. FP105]MDW8550716.1 SRPBCC family protein [Epilithonimonas ginsengisoli]OAH70820.1 cell division protein [Chryseobacterium sp. FP211-J200]
MTKIHLETLINADIQTVFDLSRNIDFHQKSTSKTNEKAIAGKTSGLIELGETVTWRAKHLGFYQTLTTKIIEMESPKMFTDIMLKGAFKSMRHQHIFREEQGRTLMIDVFEFESPFGILGKIVNQFFLNNYLRNFLIERNRMIKEIAEPSVSN